MRLLLLIFFAFSAGAQDPAPAALPASAPAPLEFQGKPIQVPFSCTEESVQAVGATCTENEPCDIFLELASIESIADRLIVSGNIHSSSNTFSSILLTSENGGKTWMESHTRIPHAVLEEIQFLDFTYGWVAGQILTQYPRDPFFLLTQDGGKTWKQRNLFDETKSGFIESYLFESRTNGMLVLDRSRGGDAEGKFELYETKTGGDSWMLREVSSQQLKIKRKTLPTGIRIRADEKTKAYWIEQHTTEKWVPLASFQIQLPTCKIGMQELAPPQESEEIPKESPQPLSPKRPPSLKKN